MARKKIIPKRIGAVKVPKTLRKLGDRVLSDPRAREVAGSALLALGTALAARGSRKGSVLHDIFGQSGSSATASRQAEADTAGRAGETVSGVADAVTQAVGEVFDTIRRDWARKVGPIRSRQAAGEAPESPRDGDDDRLH